MELIQIIVIIFVLFAYSRVILRFKDKVVTANEFIFWSVIWISIIIVALVPSITSWFSDLFGIGRPIDFVVYLSIILLFYLVFRIYVKLESVEQDVTKVVREITIKRRKK